MIRILPFDEDRVLALHIDGKMSSEDFEQVLSAVDDKLARHDTLRIYAEMHALTGVSPEALFEDLKFAVKHWQRFDREAIVTDQTWLQKLTSAAGRLMPGIEVRAFGFNEREAATDWIRAG